MGFLGRKFTVLRPNPDYKYVIELEDSSWMGYDVRITGVAMIPGATHDKVYISKNFWGKPNMSKINRLVDELHLELRLAQGEQNWDEIDARDIEKAMEAKKRENEKELKELEELLKKKKEDEKIEV